MAASDAMLLLLLLACWLEKDSGRLPGQVAASILLREVDAQALLHSRGGDIKHPGCWIDTLLDLWHSLNALHGSSFSPLYAERASVGNSVAMYRQDAHSGQQICNAAAPDLSERWFDAVAGTCQGRGATNLIESMQDAYIAMTGKQLEKFDWKVKTSGHGGED